ncbi:MAG TPA: serine/threonine-protein kinase [Planctomycetota bacterium]|nr:serine/threonine-protein kinase [Planctomycetota bacterium]
MITTSGLPVANLALRRGLVGPEDLREALAQQARDAAEGKTPRELGVLLLGRGRLTEGDLHRLVSDVGAAPALLDPARLFSFGRYRLLRTLGRGGTGKVYEAVDSADGRRVALKVLSAANTGPERERFLREARLTTTLPPHPNVVRVLEAGDVEGQPYLAMELAGGASLDAWRKSACTLRAQVAVLRQVALGVDHAHRHGILHRDLKPANVIVDASGTARVVDFGYARSLGRRDARLTDSGYIIGTPIYMSPEQARAERDVDARSDVYSLGVMLYEILAGRPPFQGRHALEVLLKSSQEPLRSPSAVAGRPVDRALEATCLKALAKDRRERHPTARAFADELGRWLCGGRQARPRRRLWPWLLLPTAAALALWAGYRRSGPEPVSSDAHREAAAQPRGPGG